MKWYVFQKDDTAPQSCVFDIKVFTKQNMLTFLFLFENLAKVYKRFGDGE